MLFSADISDYKRKKSSFMFARSNKFSALTNSPHNHEGIEIFIMLNGKALFHIEGNSYTVENGDIVIANENETHFFTHDKNEFDRIVIGISNDFFKSSDFIRYSYIFFDRNPGKCCHISASALIKQGVPEALDRLENYLNDSSTPETVISACLIEFFYLFEKAYKDTYALKASYNDFMDNVLNYINSNISENLRLETIAKHFFVSEQYLCRIFKKSYGITINDYITQTRMNLYFKFLKTGYNIQKASEKAGFGSYSAFFRAYKKLCGTSPKKDINNKRTEL